MKRYLCIHGHFYQPPRENAWLEAIEQQDEAYPYHDWNERITDECYAPNAVSRILDRNDHIVRIVNNYGRISFNFGPTLLAWLEHHQTDVHAAIIEADRESATKFGGHGSAMAQPFNHMIMPLATPRDRRSQVLWGMRDFERRFRRPAEGMWLPETAVDVDSLEALAEAGIRFTVLAPHQAARVRPLGGGDWQDVSGGRVDTTRAYLQKLPSGRDIVLFFYDGPVSQAVAFQRLLTDGGTFAARLMAAFPTAREGGQLVHIATDGETYGHHHRHGDMALAYALEVIDRDPGVRLTNYGEFLELHPPDMEVEAQPDTSWSCTHGVERWRSHCGCSTGGQTGWRQEWRRPLREGLDWLRDSLEQPYAENAGMLLTDPWLARDDYIGVILDRSEESALAFLAAHERGELDTAGRVRALKLLEMQRHLMLMYTSCGWFFNEVSGIETVQVMHYAARAIQLAREALQLDLEPGFLERLERAPSNLAERGSARRIYEANVRPALVDLEKVGAHYAIASLFESYGDPARIYCYELAVQDRHLFEAGKARLSVGRATVRSLITLEDLDVSFGVLHFGDHNVNGGVRTYQGDDRYAELLGEVQTPFDRADFPAVLRCLDRNFGASTYSLGSLFTDERRRILDRLLQASLSDAEEVYRRLYQDTAPLMRFLANFDLPQPGAFQMAAQFVLDTSLRRAFADENANLRRARALLDEARNGNVPLDEAGLGYALEGTLERLALRLRQDPEDLATLKRLEAFAELAVSLPFAVSLWELQNIYWSLLQDQLPLTRARAANDDADAREWVDRFISLGKTISVAVE